jgi:hypothetical protein
MFSLDTTTKLNLSESTYCREYLKKMLGASQAGDYFAPQA